MNIPSHLKFTPDHEWVLIEGDTATIGITDFAQRELGDIVYVDINQSTDTFAQNEVFGSVEAVKTVSDLFMPMSGKITAINSELENHPEWVNEDPYEKGWMIKVSLSSLEEAENLLDAAAYEALLS
ncbi:MAG: glycine cleavage system protein GcvH [Chitinophagales bacterium]|nr:glycine cleavage system protein GcvH [Bacteroidota bacterium]MCB9043565.1 glycine cleavage system protein GcvH [Chitinophagales bacterium]